MNEMAPPRALASPSLAGRSMPAALMQPLGFVVLSGGGWLLDFALFWAMMQTFGMAPAFANVASAATTAMVVYVLSRRLLFGRRGRLSRDFFVYFAYTLANIAFWGLSIQFLAAGLFAVHAADTGLQAALLAKIAVTPLSLTANFLMARALSRRPAHA